MATAAITGLLSARALRRGKWNPRPGGPTGHLYDLAVDPGELHNLYQARPEIVDRLAASLQ